MGLRINNNSAAINGHRNLLKNDANLSRTLERLSSGMKINRAADGSAGLVISEQMRSQITGLTQAVDNTSTAVSMLQTAEGAMDEINTLLNKARQLVLHAANEGANDQNQMAADQAELDQVIASVTRIGDFTQFGTKKLLDGSLSGGGNLTTGLTRVRVGNLANNAALATGTATIVVNGGAQETNTMLGGSIDDGYIFSPANTSGMNVNSTGSVATVNSGVTITLKIDDNTITYTTTQAQTVSQVSSSLNALLTGYQVAFDSSAGGFAVSRSTIGAADFASTLTFTRGSTPTVQGVGESVASTVQLTAGTNGNASNIIFTGTATTLSGINENVTVASGAVFRATVGASDGSTGFTVAYTSSGETLQSVLANLATAISGQSSTLGFTGGATLQLVGGAQDGFTVALNRTNSSISADYNFNLRVDWNNSITSTYEIRTTALTGSTFPISGGVNPAGTSTWITSATGGAASGNSGGITMSGTNTYLASGAAIALTINGETKVVTGGTTQTLDAIATALTSMFSTEGFRISWLDSGDTTSGTYFDGINASGGAGTFTGAGFYVSNINGEKFTFTLAVDNISSVDVTLTGLAQVSGTTTAATLNLDTISQARTNSISAQVGHAAVSIVNASGSTQNTAGSDVTATLTTANGVAIGLTQSAVTLSGAATLVLDASATAAGYERFYAEITSGMATAGGVVNFDLSDGAVFQVGPNDSQRVGVTIESVAATELGRNVVGGGKLLCLDDLVSTKRGAIVNGMMNEALKVIDATIDEVTNMRGRIGAIQANTLETGLNSLRATQENMTNAESVIRDADFAAESAQFTRYNILVQSSTSMLAQANQLPQSVLKLLQ